MNYELAKKLKDAGFPQVGRFGEGVQYVYEPKLKKYILCGSLESYDIDPEHIYVPTLSELIEACGNGLQSLINNFYNKEKGWIAFTNRKDSVGERMEIWGKTPEEAVANLWFALQETKGE